ncbi:hypothetical protein VTH8203_02638 [Vibrio thalassae]|uniref:Uncharacterized protein n=1 Tax=Vibrio thalassae TaxID=1243014 RepID=A0A240EKI0_9VIBR|nr:hypothetical protein [Vibrio thalassae]SNX49001.1 hypothetical protein VTH8203_02638 [Vibrio thalassae]
MQRYIINGLLFALGCIPEHTFGQYIAELDLHIPGIYIGKTVIGLEESKLLVQGELTSVFLVSQSYVVDEEADLNFIIIEQSNREPANYNQLTLPSISTTINNKAGVEVDGSFSYTIIVHQQVLR